MKTNKLSRGQLATLVLAVMVAFVLGGLIFGGDHSASGNTQESSGENTAPTVWTCSMHPQIKLSRPGQCPICFMDLIPLESGSGDDLGPRQLRLSETARQLARIETSPAVRAFGEAEVRMVGRVTWDETRLAYITAWAPGRLDRLYADYTGIRVAKGDHLVELYSPELLAAQEELIQAAAAVEVLGDTRSTVLKSTSEATVEAAREKLRLYGLAPEQIREIETSRKTSDRLTINAPVGGVVVRLDEREGAYVTTGSRIYTIADLSRLWVTFEAYESDLPWLRYAQPVTFSSPSFPGDEFTAVISFIDPVVNKDTRTVKVRGIVENKKVRLKPDMFVQGKVRSKLDSYGRVIDEYLAGKWISPMHPEVVKNGPGQCDVCGMDLVPAESLGYAGKAVTKEEAPLLIPASAPLLTGKRAVVYVEIPDDEGPLFEGREVELGPRAGDFYVVVSGIEEGEKVVTNGAFKIDSELQLQAKPSMMSPTGQGSIGEHKHDGTMPGAAMSVKDAGSEAPVESARVQKELSPVYTTYFDVQMALANDDIKGAAKAAGELEGRIEEVDMDAFSRQGHSHWMEMSGVLAEQSARLAAASDSVEARDAFFYLSNEIIRLHERFGHDERRYFYLTYCPMARNNTGAYWLQTESIVWNSFWGAQMLRCGTIKDSSWSTTPEGQ